MKKLFAAALIALTAMSVSACAPVEKSDLTIVDGWVRFSEYSDHVDGMTGAFASITNNTDHEITIVGGSSEIAGMVEVHEVVMADGAMKMQAKEGGIAIGEAELRAHGFRALRADVLGDGAGAALLALDDHEAGGLELTPEDIAVSASVDARFVAS